MSNKQKKPWDDVIHFDEWKEEKQDSSNEDFADNFSEQIIEPVDLSGVGITNEPEEEIDLMSMIQGINKENSSYNEMQKEKERKEEEERERLYQEEREAEKKQKLMERIEWENSQRELDEFEKNKAAMEAAAEAARKKEASPINKLTKSLKPEKKEKEPKEKEEVVKEPEKELVEIDTSYNPSPAEDIGIKKGKEVVVKRNVSKNDSPVKKEVVEKEKKRFFPFTGKKEKQPKESEIKISEPKKSPVKEKKEESAEMDWEYIATHDKMTGLLNQNAFEVFKKKEHSGVYAVIMVDVNNLKYANDNFGHEAGNKLIIAVADEIKKIFPKEGYRTGGDEFVVVKEFGSEKRAEDLLQKMKKEFLDDLKEKTTEEKASGGKLIYAASFGYAICGAGESFSEVCKRADENMYKDKEAYKKANPHLDMRRAVEKKPDKKDSVPSTKGSPLENYDELLTEEQRAFKKKIASNHIQVSTQSTIEIVREVQSRASEIVAILISSPSFDDLFIILSPDSFISIIDELGSTIDYSYLYLIYKDEAKYKGSDEYLKEVVEIFSDLGKRLSTGKINSEKDLLKVKGINVFKHIYFA